MAKLRCVLLVPFCILTLALVACESQEQKIHQFITQLGAEDAQVRAQATEALGQIGEPAVEALIAALRHENPSLRASVVWKLSEIGRPINRIVPALIGALGDASENVGVAASMALADIGEPAVRFLIEALKDEKADIRLHVAYVLGEIGSPADTIIPALILRLGDKESNVRRVSVRALLNFGPRAVPQLKEALNDDNAATRRFAQIALTQMEHRKR